MATVSRRMERAPTADDARPEEYDETGKGAKARPLHEAEPEPEPKRSHRIREWMRMRKRGWRKNPHGHGFLCPDASCLTAGDFASRTHHDSFHEDVWQGFAHADKLIDELWAEMDKLREEHAAEIKRRDEIIGSMDKDMGYLTAQMDTMVGIHSIQHVPTHEPPGAEGEQTS